MYWSRGTGPCFGIDLEPVSKLPWVMVRVLIWNRPRTCLLPAQLLWLVDLVSDEIVIDSRRAIFLKDGV